MDENAYGNRVKAVQDLEGLSLIERAKLKFQAQEAQEAAEKAKSLLSNSDQKSVASSPIKIDRRSDNLDDDNESNLSRNMNNNSLINPLAAGPSASYHQNKINSMMSNIKQRNHENLFGGFKLNKENYRQDELAYDFRIDKDGLELDPRSSLKKKLDAQYKSKQPAKYYHGGSPNPNTSPYLSVPAQAKGAQPLGSLR